MSMSLKRINYQPGDLFRNRGQVSSQTAHYIFSFYCNLVSNRLNLKNLRLHSQFKCWILIYIIILLNFWKLAWFWNTCCFTACDKKKTTSSWLLRSKTKDRRSCINIKYSYNTWWCWTLLPFCLLPKFLLRDQFGKKNVSN